MTTPTATPINGQPNVPPIEIHPAVKRGVEIVGSLAVGALSGYIFYGVTWLVEVSRIAERLGMGKGGASGPIHPLPYVLSGVIGAAIFETARLIYDLGVYVLGERAKYENLENPGKAPTFDRLRQKTWKVIGCVEGVEHKVDAAFSRVFKIRTSKEIHDQNLLDRELYFMEITRRAFWAQVGDTIKTAIPQELSIYAVEALGFTIVGAHAFVWLHGFMFLNGLIEKVSLVYQKIQTEEAEIKAILEAELKEPQEQQNVAKPKKDGKDPAVAPVDEKDEKKRVSEVIMSFF